MTQHAQSRYTVDTHTSTHSQKGIHTRLLYCQWYHADIMCHLRVKKITQKTIHNRPDGDDGPQEGYPHHSHRGCHTPLAVLTRPCTTSHKELGNIAVDQVLLLHLASGLC